MAFDGVPWLVGGGAEHSAEVGRVLAYACADGGEGIIGASSFKVRARTVPDNNVNIFPGAAILHNNSLLPTTEFEAYAIRAATATLVPITATTSSGPRSDLVIARVEDPQYAPWPDPVNPVVGPYSKPFVIQNVPSGITDIRDLDGSFAVNYPAITLARVDVPASTATIQNAHITDLRQIANPRVLQTDRTYRPSAASYFIANTTFTTWPTSWTQRIPKWATALSIRVIYSGVAFQGANIFQDYRATVSSGATTLITAITNVDLNKSGETWNGERASFIHADQLAIPVAVRGKVATFALQARTIAGDNGVGIDAASVIAIDLSFTEVAE